MSSTPASLNPTTGGANAGVNRHRPSSPSLGRRHVAEGLHGHAIVEVKTSLYSRLGRVVTLQDMGTLLSEDADDIAAVLATALLLVLFALFVLRRLSETARVPAVLLYLSAGIALRLFHDPLTAAQFDIAVKPVVRTALAAVGLQIGSHLTRQTLEPLLRPMLRFLLVFVPIVVGTVTVAAASLFPHLAEYAVLAGCIAVERSSPAALSGITAHKAAGPFTTSVMCITALQDVAALALFVIFAAVVGASLSEAAWHLTELSVGTALATAATLLFARAVTSLVRPTPPPPSSSSSAAAAAAAALGGGSDQEANAAVAAPETHTSAGSAGPHSPPQPPPSPLRGGSFMALWRRLWSSEAASRVLIAAAVAFAIPLISWFFHVELLLAAVLAGSALSYDHRHPLADVLDRHEAATGAVLFCLIGHRIELLAYLQSGAAAVVLYIARLAGLAIGAYCGAVVAPLVVAPPLTSSPPNASGPAEVPTTGGTVAIHSVPSLPPSQSPPPTAVLLLAPPPGATTQAVSPAALAGHTAALHKVRWMALVTQLAIALSLVDRLQQLYPEAAPLAQAYGGAAILALATGPPMLSYALRASGEAGRAADGHH